MGKFLKYLKFAVILLILYLILNIGWQFISVQIKYTNVKGEMKEMLFGEIRSDEYEIAEKALNYLETQDIYIEYSDISIVKPKSNQIRVKFAYTDSVGIPFINKYFYLSKEVDELISKM
ncbi:hypothetical protein KAU15_05040 [candidate division WOR-3 bacterium]|nr:hypothetical protein [candidate division WOR-3 bacterium]